MKNLRDQVVVVTGASGAIGQALCRELASGECRLGLLGRNRSALETLAEDLRGRNAVASVHQVDVRDRAAVREAIAGVLRRWGRVDVMVHNAGVGRSTCAWSADLDDVAEMLEVNYLGGVYAVEAVLPSMFARRRGHLVAVSSLAALRGMAWTAGYSASKAALGTFLESLRPALRRRGIIASTCYLGFVRTPMSDALPLHPALWRISPQRAARRIARVIRRRPREAYLPWYDAAAARLLRRLPARLFDAVMGSVGRRMIRGEY